MGIERMEVGTRVLRNEGDWLASKIHCPLSLLGLSAHLSCEVEAGPGQ